MPPLAATLTGCDRAVQHCVNSPAVRPLSLGRWSGRSIAPCASLWVSGPIGAPGNLRRGGTKRRKAPLKLRRAPPPIFYFGQVSSAGRFSPAPLPSPPPPLGAPGSTEPVWLGSHSTCAGGNRKENNAGVLPCDLPLYRGCQDQALRVRSSLDTPGKFF